MSHYFNALFSIIPCYCDVFQRNLSSQNGMIISLSMNIFPVDIHSIFPCLPYEFSLAQLKHNNFFRESYNYFMEYTNLLFLKCSCIGVHTMIIQFNLMMSWIVVHGVSFEA